MKKGNINVKKAIYTLYSITVFQVFAFIGVIIYINFVQKSEAADKNIFYYSLIMLVFISMMASTRDLFLLKRVKMQDEYKEKTMEMMEDLNITLRAQRHDFLNHLQVVNMLIEMDEYVEAKSYINKVYKDIVNVNVVLKTSKPAINALLKAKLSDCESRKIEMELDIKSKLEDLKVPSWEMCRVMGNIIDNAIYVLNKRGFGTLEIEILENVDEYTIIIKNDGPKIEEDVLNKIFEAGYSTKKEEGDGMGLYITKEIVERYEGKIEVSSTEEKTVFEIKIKRDITDKKSDI